MFRSSTKIVGVVLCVVIVLLSGCQAIQPNGINPQSEAWIEQMKAEAIAQEVGTFKHGMERDLAAIDAETGAGFYSVAENGAISERAAFIDSNKDEKFVFLEPEVGKMRAEMITPDVFMVTYPMTFHGAYDGNEFVNPIVISSLWVKHNGVWQNEFLQMSTREGELEPVAN